MDRTSEWEEAVEYACQQLHISKDATRRKPSEYAPTNFTKVALAVIQSVNNLRDFIRLHQKDYLTGSVYSEADKDSIEAEIGLTVKAVGQQVDALKNSVLAAQGSPDASPAAVAALQEQQQASGIKAQGPAINEQTAAHLHGVVLCLAETLHAVVSRFDRARAQRYQQIADKEAKKAAMLAPRPTASTSSHPASGTSATSQSVGKPAVSQGGQSGQPVFEGPGAWLTKGLSNGTAGEAAAYGMRVGSALLGRVKGAGGMIKGAGEAAWSRASGQPSSNGGTPELGHSSTSAAQPPHVSQQQLLEAENMDLVERLSTTATQVQGIERSVREIAVLNQMFSTAILHQAEAIEHIYTAAVEASQNIKAGNKELKKTVTVNRSTQRYILVLLIAASLGLLLLDWMNS